jgi:hypothetical protein
VIASVVANTLDAAARACQARSERALRRAVDSFVGRLSVVPDAAPGALSRDDTQKIREASEAVIDHIELLLDTAPGLPAQPLVSAVYEIRRLLEALAVWERHFPAARELT